MLPSVVQVPCIFPLPPCSVTQLPGSHAGEPPPDTHALHTCWERLGRKHSCLLFKLKRTTSGICVLCLDTYAQLGLHRAAPTLVGHQRWHERPHFSHVCYSHPILTFSYPLISLLRKKAPASLFRRKGPSGTQGVSPLCVLLLVHALSSLPGYWQLLLPTFLSQAAPEWLSWPWKLTRTLHIMKSTPVRSTCLSTLPNSNHVLTPSHSSRYFSCPQTYGRCFNIKGLLVDILIIWVIIYCLFFLRSWKIIGTKGVR